MFFNGYENNMISPIINNCTYYIIDFIKGQSYETYNSNTYI